MSDLSNDNSSISGARVCECYKKLQSYGIPLYIHEENDFCVESPKITYELAFPLPGRLEIDESITEYLVVQDNDLYNVFYHMAAVIPELSGFDTNVLNFWLLDIFIEGLWTAQNANMNSKHQKITLLWIAYCFNHIQKENPSRSQFFDHLKGVLFQLGCYQLDADSDTNEKIGELTQIYSASASFTGPLVSDRKSVWEVPYPPDYVYKEIKNAEYSAPSSEEENLTASDLEETAEATQPEEMDEVVESQKNCEHMKIILEIIYRIFGRLWVFLEIQTVLQNMPPTNLVYLPFKLPIPKPLMKTGSNIFQFKTEKGGKRQPASERLGEVEFEKEVNRNDFIFPLQLAEESMSILKQHFTGSSSQLSMNKQRKGHCPTTASSSLQSGRFHALAVTHTMIAYIIFY